jgi:hypothetical protein
VRLEEMSSVRGAVPLADDDVRVDARLVALEADVADEVIAATRAASASSGAATTGRYMLVRLNAARQWKRKTWSPSRRKAAPTKRR